MKDKQVTTTTSSAISYEFFVHSTFREDDGDDHQSSVLVPSGLEWDLLGSSYMIYIPQDLKRHDHEFWLSSLLPSSSLSSILNENGDGDEEMIQMTTKIKWGIVQAHNRWCFAKDLPFRTVEDMEELTVVEEKYYRGNDQDTDDDDDDDDINNICTRTTFLGFRVTWKTSTMIDTDNQHTTSIAQNVDEVVNLLQQDLASTSTGLRSDSQTRQDSHNNNHNGLLCWGPPQVWVNGYFVAHFSDDKTFHEILDQVRKCQSLRFRYKRTKSLIRIERYFRGGLYQHQDIYDHILDNLYALEDVKLIAEDEELEQDASTNTTLIGTATIPDWIMGGELTSRLWIQHKVPLRSNDTDESRCGCLGGIIRFRRPLHSDDLATSDRTFDLCAYNKKKEGEEEDNSDKIYHVLEELERLKFLSSLPYPQVDSSTK